jgi:GNAT superfamily N-acetyltransferase
MRISSAKPEDSAALTEIAFSAKRHWGYPERWIRRWKRILTLTPAYIRAHPTYAARAGARIVGFAALKLDGAVAILDHIWVSPAQIGGGVGSLLFLRCEREARRMGATVLKVESDPNAEEFYHAMGAITVGRTAAPMDGKKRYLPLLEKKLV